MSDKHVTLRIHYYLKKVAQYSNKPFGSQPARFRRLMAYKAAFMSKHGLSNTEEDKP